MKNQPLSALLLFRFFSLFCLEDKDWVVTTAFLAIMASAAKNVTRLLTTLMGSGGKKKVDPKSLTPMVYPYTRTAQWIQTDWVHLWKNAWMYRYMSYAWLTTVPLWLWIDSKGRFFHRLLCDLHTNACLSVSLSIHSELQGSKTGLEEEEGVGSQERTSEGMGSRVKNLFESKNVQRIERQTALLSMDKILRNKSIEKIAFVCV